MIDFHLIRLFGLSIFVQKIQNDGFGNLRSEAVEIIIKTVLRVWNIKSFVRNVRLF